ncbi:MAG: hypothetical protein ABSE16_04465 [Verrucomicrobiota bacterium]
MFEWCIRSARRQLGKGQSEKAAQWCALASFLAAGPGWFGCLANAELEDVLLQIAAILPTVRPSSSRALPRRWLHVMTQAWYWGGMVENLKRWILFSHEETVNEVVVLDQRNSNWLGPLQAIVEEAGGSLLNLTCSSPLLEKAAALRRLAAERADAVVLHTSTTDVVPALAFGVAGGPPILRMNVDDHMFWPGISAMDLIINFRELGERWMLAHRGSDRSYLLPLPVANPAPVALPSRRTAARVRFGISDDAVVLLAVGSDYKFKPVGEWDFIKAAERILARCPGSVILVAGVPATGCWQASNPAFAGRLKALGVQTDLTDCHAACDIGLGSVPFPSQTAVLEIGLQKKPCVLTPADVPMGINDVAFEQVSQPANMNEYTEMAVQLVFNPSRRQAEGQRLAESIDRHHCQNGWRGYWQGLQKRVVTVEHEVYPLLETKPMNDEECEFWTTLRVRSGQDILSHVHFNAITEKRRIWPMPDRTLNRTQADHNVGTILSSAIFGLRKLRFSIGGMRRRILQSEKSGESI